MAMGRPKAELMLTDEEQAQLQAIARSRALPAALVRRANVWTATADSILAKLQRLCSRINGTKH